MLCNAYDNARQIQSTVSIGNFELKKLQIISLWIMHMAKGRSTQPSTSFGRVPH